VNERYEAALIDAATLTFKTFSPALPTATLTKRPEWLAVNCCSSVAFTGTLSGSLSITMYGKALAAIAGDMMEIRGIPKWSVQEDVLAELSNVICGNILPAIGGKDALFDVGSPQIDDITRQTDQMRNSIPPAARVVIEIADGCAELSLFLKNVSARR
jgi:hypothetical protein